MEGYRSATTTMRCAMRNRTFSLNLTVWLWVLGLPGFVMGQTQSDSNDGHHGVTLTCRGRGPTRH
ncbi:MAG: hypothetical protein Ct9H300mP25_14650 [Acidobacteriota bacterium]|nr:MAG: hypothetical protein Ct9H300mP25_14650 [Acidobacteriota bacterium]